MDPLQVRASDGDRDRAVELLRDAHAAGRLDTRELDERIVSVTISRTYADLHEILADLPIPDSKLPAPNTRPAEVVRPAPAPAPTRRSVDAAQRQRAALLSIILMAMTFGGLGWVATAPGPDVYADTYQADTNGAGGPQGPYDDSPAEPSEKLMASNGLGRGSELYRHEGEQAVLTVKSETGARITVRVGTDEGVVRTTGAGEVTLVVPSGSHQVRIAAQGDWSYQVQKPGA